MKLNFLNLTAAALTAVTLAAPASAQDRGRHRSENYNRDNRNDNGDNRNYNGDNRNDYRPNYRPDYRQSYRPNYGYGGYGGYGYGRPAYRPYVFRPRFRLGFGIFVGYPVTYSYEYA